MDLSDFIYDYNLVTTNTTKDVYERCEIINSGRGVRIDYQDCVSLYDIVEIFNKSYLKFLEDKNKLKSILQELGRKVEYGFHSISENFSSLCLGVTKPYPNIFDEKWAIIYFVNNDGNFYVSANNGKNMFDEKYKNKGVKIDQEKIKTCLDIVKKHNLFLEVYKDLKSKFIFGNGTTVLFSKLEGDIFDELSTFTLSFGNAYMNSEDYIEVKFRLGDKLEVIYDEAKVILEDNEINDLDKKTKIINELLSELYIHSDYLKRLYKNNDQGHILRKRDNNE